MGQTLQSLSSKSVESKPIFSNRFVVELCQEFHVHYQNIRLILSPTDWFNMAEGMSDALKRWKSLGSPEPGDKHIELCRKKVATRQLGEPSININLNKNLYLENDGRIFAEGAEFKDPTYIHLKIRDIRLEMSIEEFKQLSEAVKEAEVALCQK